jgi:hypothetical protein
MTSTSLRGSMSLSIYLRCFDALVIFKTLMFDRKIIAMQTDLGGGGY